MLSSFSGFKWGLGDISSSVRGFVRPWRGASVCCLIATLGISACQAPPNIKALQDQNAALEEKLAKANKNIDSLQADKVLLEQNNAELSRVVSVIGQEKSSRVAESTNLRGEVRQFVQQQIDTLKQFLLASNLLDYVGGELVERAEVDDKPRLLVDLLNPIPRDGTLTGVGAYFQDVGTFSVKVLRPVKDDLVVIWSSSPITVKARGRQRMRFPVVVGVEKGDYLAYYLHQPKLVGFDMGTGKTRYIDEDVTVGSSFRKSSLNGEKAKRAYSMGVYGLLNAQ